jgi:hypothetical protein
MRDSSASPAPDILRLSNDDTQHCNGNRSCAQTTLLTRPPILNTCPTTLLAGKRRGQHVEDEDEDETVTNIMGDTHNDPRGDESPNKRARTGSPSDHGNYTRFYMFLHLNASLHVLYRDFLYSD